MAKKPKRIPSLLTIDGGAGSVELLAAADDEAAESPQPPPFRMNAYNGGKMDLPGFFWPVVVDLSGMSVSSKARPVLREHRREWIVGHTDQVDVTARSVKANGVISADNEHSRDIVSSSKNKFPWQSSIGAKILEAEFIDARESATVNGRKFKGPLIVARKTSLREISFVVLGGDDTTSANIAATAAGEEIEVTMAKKRTDAKPTNDQQDQAFAAWLTAKGWDGADAADELSDNQREFLRATFDAEQQSDDDPPAKPKKTAKPKTVEASADDDVDDDPFGRRARAEDIRRGKAIHELCAKAEGLESSTRLEIEAQAIEAGWDEQRTELEILRQRRPEGPAIHATSDGGEMRPNIIEASLLLQLGHAEKDVAATYRTDADEIMEAALSSEMRSVGIQTLCYETIRAAGKSYRPGQVDNNFIRAALEADRMLQASSGFSTVSLSGILGNTANKMLRMAFERVDSKWPQFCSIASHRDFKTHTKYRMTLMGDYEEVGPSGELKHASADEESFTNEVDTYGRIVALTRKQIVNDDLDAFSRLPRALGRLAAIKMEKAVFTLLLSNPSSFFSSGNSNYFDGATSALDIDSLTTAEQKFLDQTDLNGDPVMIAPALLLVPTALKVTAESLFSERVVNQQPASNKAKTRDNPHAGKFRPVASPYLNAQGLASQSSVGWYLLGDPRDAAVIEMALLNGRRVPIIENSEADFDQLGMKWRSYHDFGVAMDEHRAGVFSKGEA